jgi:hypothetical protein
MKIKILDIERDGEFSTFTLDVHEALEDSVLRAITNINEAVRKNQKDMEQKIFDEAIKIQEIDMKTDLSKPELYNKSLDLSWLKFWKNLTYGKAFMMLIGAGLTTMFWEAFSSYLDGVRDLRFFGIIGVCIIITVLISYRIAPRKKKEES